VAVRLELAALRRMLRSNAAAERATTFRGRVRPASRERSQDSAEESAQAKLPLAVDATAAPMDARSRVALAIGLRGVVSRGRRSMQKARELRARGWGRPSPRLQCGERPRARRKRRAGATASTQNSQKNTRTQRTALLSVASAVSALKPGRAGLPSGLLERLRRGRPPFWRRCSHSTRVW
jgi:hypothetical protein